MNRATHAWLAVEAFKKIRAAAATPTGAAKVCELDGLVKLLGEYLDDVVMAAWLPDNLIADNATGHIFKNALYTGEQQDRFTLSKTELTARLARDAKVPGAVFSILEPEEWWGRAYRVRQKGGHLPARIIALCQSARDMFMLGDAQVEQLTGVTHAAADPVPHILLFSPQHIATTLWMLSHYIADAHMPCHCDNRALARSDDKHGWTTHGAIEDLWGEQVPELFTIQGVLGVDADAILAAPLPEGSRFAGLDFGKTISPLRNGDVWLEAVYICRASMATSFVLVPEGIAAVDDRTKHVSLPEILDSGPRGFCGEERFWQISMAIMVDAVNAIARTWVHAWCDAAKLSEGKAAEAQPVLAHH